MGDGDGDGEFHNNVGIDRVIPLNGYGDCVLRRARALAVENPDLMRFSDDFGLVISGSGILFCEAIRNWLLRPEGEQSAFTELAIARALGEDY